MKKVFPVLLILTIASATSAQPVMRVQLPFQEGFSARCTQNSNDTPTHQGDSTRYDLDFGVPVGTRVTAAAAGIVNHGSNPDGFGSYIRLDHGNGYWTMYGHLSGYEVGNGTFAKAGDVIALSGGAPGTPGAGNSTAPHLHFGVHGDPGVGISRPMGVYAFDVNLDRWVYQSTESHTFTCDASATNQNGHRYEARPMFCDVAKRKCDINTYGSVGWYPPINDCRQATQWFLMQDTSEGKIPIGSSHVGSCDMIPAACYPYSD